MDPSETWFAALGRMIFRACRLEFCCSMVARGFQVDQADRKSAEQALQLIVKHAEVLHASSDRIAVADVKAWADDVQTVLRARNGYVHWVEGLRQLDGEDVPIRYSLRYDEEKIRPSDEDEVDDLNKLATRMEDLMLAGYRLVYPDY